MKTTYRQNIFKSIVFVAMPLLILTTSCTNPLSPKEMVRWIEDEKNGYKQVVEKGDIKLVIQERPLVYRLCIENRGIITKEHLKEIKKNENCDGLLQFHLKISTADELTPLLLYNVADESEYFDRLRYYTSEVEQDLMLINGADTVYPVLCLFERNYHLAPYNTLTFAFEKPENLKKKYQLVYNEMVFNKTPISFLISNNKKKPKLKI